MCFIVKKWIIAVSLFHYIGIICRYSIEKYGGGGDGTKKRPLSAPLFVATGPDDELFVRDFDTKIKRLVVFTSGAQELIYSHCVEWAVVFKNITGIALGTKVLYVADSSSHCIGKLQKLMGVNVCN